MPVFLHLEQDAAALHAYPPRSPRRPQPRRGQHLERSACRLSSNDSTRNLALGVLEGIRSEPLQTVAQSLVAGAQIALQVLVRRRG